MTESHLPDLLDLLGVERVIVIDDLFTPPPAIMLAFASGEGPAIDGLPELPDGADYEQHLEQHWPEVPIAIKVDIRKKALKVDGFIDPTGDATGLKPLVGDRPFRGLTLHEWELLGETILAGAERALVLFDVNFQQETGDEDDEAGLGPAGRALHASHDHIIGLLTSKANAGDEEHAASGWASTADVKRADLVVVNKNLLGDPQNSEHIAQAVQQIRTALQASQLGRLREKIYASLDTGLKNAATQLGARSPTLLEDLVFKASRDGGEWEGDTWFRLFSTLGFGPARRDVAIDKQARRAIVDVRNLLHARPAATHDDSAAFAGEIQRAECYDDADYINQAGLPIANGDIFKSGTGPAFILVGQPCDLALRPDGRAKDPSTATLLPIKQRALDGDADEPSAYRLPSGSPLGDGDWEVRFRPEYHVAFDVLDLVSFNTEGKASFQPAERVKLSPLLPGLQARSDAIAKVIRQHETALNEITRLLSDKQITKVIATQLRHSTLNAGGPFRATLNGTPTPFAFSCTRVGRLAGTYADALLTAHAGARSRTAHAHELTRIVDDSAG